MKRLAFFVAATFVFTGSIAQTPCSGHNIYGTWKKLGYTQSTYDRPPSYINADSLINVLSRDSSSNNSWAFTTDGRYIHKSISIDYINKGRFWVENDCALKLSSRKKDPIRIVYLDEKYLILWHNNPKTAYLTLYHR